jgi:PrsW family intramembrane metalloprotease
MSTPDAPTGVDEPCVDESRAASAEAAARWLPFGAADEVAEWRGDHWTGRRAAAPALGPPPPWRRRAFPGRWTWLWLVLFGQVLCLGSGVLVALTHERPWALTSGFGYAVVMAGPLVLVARVLKIDTIAGLRRIIAVGVVSGVVASAAAISFETLIHVAIGREVLWCAGPIEETLKLAVPLVLLWCAAPLVTDPRCGAFLVMVSAATFGAIEGASYSFGYWRDWTSFFMDVVRPGTELFHPFLTAFAAAVIWLAAKRAGRLVTRVGVGAYAVAVLVHSVRDGLGSFGRASSAPFAPTLGRALTLGAVPALVTWGVTLAFFTLMRYGVRELVPPGGLGELPPRWRPRIRRWGVERLTRPTTSPLVTVNQGET